MSLQTEVQTCSAIGQIEAHLSLESNSPTPKLRQGVKAPKKSLNMLQDPWMWVGVSR